MVAEAAGVECPRRRAKEGGAPPPVLLLSAALAAARRATAAVCAAATADVAASSAASCDRSARVGERAGRARGAARPMKASAAAGALPSPHDNTSDMTPRAVSAKGKADVSEPWCGKVRMGDRRAAAGSARGGGEGGAAGVGAGADAAVSSAVMSPGRSALSMELSAVSAACRSASEEPSIPSSLVFVFFLLPNQLSTAAGGGAGETTLDIIVNMRVGSWNGQPA